jgi:hypothetical protein
MENIIKMDLRKISCGIVDFTYLSRTGNDGRLYEQGNVPSGSIKGEQFDYLNDY